MKRNLFLGIILLSSFILLSSTCNNSGDFTLKNGESVTRKIDGINYRIAVTDINDSRCPKDVKCVRAGEAFVNVSFKSGSGGEQLLQFCTGLDCRRSSITDTDTVGTPNEKIEIKLLSVTPDPTQTTTDGPKKATFTIRKL